MTTTSRRPPRTPPKRQPSRRRKPADGTAAEPAKPSGTAAKPAAKKAPAKKAPAKPAAKKTTKTTKTTKAPKAPAKATGTTAPPKTTPKKRATPKTAPKSTVEAAPRRVAQSPPRTPFILLIVGLLGGALVSLLLLNTVLAKDAFTLTGLQQSNERLEERAQELEVENAEARSPEKIAEIAENLGMKPNEVPVFFDTDTGRTSGGEIRPVPHADAAAATAAERHRRTGHGRP
ncbi:hypothetical protein BJF79_46170, partial [Actinomadura sp. CNU-125]|uniref:hypothetical protein n=1 Tax=Actinomadura sp. CNU-125 TaxID=1904961 RepID=UPI000966DCB3